MDNDLSTDHPTTPRQAGNGSTRDEHTGNSLRADEFSPGASSPDELEGIDARAPLLTDDALVDRIARLIGRACRRQLWLLFLDERSVMLPTLMPNDELPFPLGAEAAARVAGMLRQALAGTPIESVILVWERAGGPIATADDTESAAALGWACADAGVPVRAQLISHDFGVRLLGAEEFAPVVAATTAEALG